LARYSATSAAASNSNRSSPCRSVRAGAVGARQQHGELLAAEPAHHVGLADLLPELGRQRAQHLVADQVAVTVVDPLEVIDVDQQQGQR
jgi:hypothetical protein